LTETPNSQAIAVLSQNLNGGATVGQVYFLTVEVNLPGLLFPEGCAIEFRADSQVILSYNYGKIAQHGPVNASGIFDNTPSNLDLSMSCADGTGSPIDTWGSFDNVQLSVYDPFTGTNPIQPAAAQVLVNNEFESGKTTPWVPYTTPDGGHGMDFDVISGRAVITYSRISPSLDSPAWISQVLKTPAEVGDRVRFEADVYIEIPTAGATCSVQVFTGAPMAWTVENVVSSQTHHVDVSLTLTAGTDQFYLFSTCKGTDTTTTISFDNIYYTVNAFPAPSEGLVNNNFKSGILSPWKMEDDAGTVDFAVVDGRAAITYSQIDADMSSPSRIYQTLQKPIEAGQHIRIRANVKINIPNPGTKCMAQIFTGTPIAWSVRDVGSSQSFPVDVSMTVDQGSAWFYMFGPCIGTGETTSISFDNVYLTLNAF
jgi:hypothetical protein